LGQPVISSLLESAVNKNLKRVGSLIALEFTRNMRRSRSITMLETHLLEEDRALTFDQKG
jgi:hypothetical protein